MKKSLRIAFQVLTLLAVASSSKADDLIWGLQNVDGNGNGTHAKVGADPGLDPANSPNRVSVTGIALNAPQEILNSNLMWQVYLQAESPDAGGIATWSGIFYNPDWPRYPADIEPGDRVRINGFVENASGKVNINERHSAAPGMRFTVEKLASDVGMPDPIVIPNVAACNAFDATRATGGEKYQAQWIRLNDVHIVSGTWAAGNSLIIADTTGTTITMLLSERGDFGRYPAPTGVFSLQGIFDQEDGTAPYTGDYRIWVKHYSDIAIPSGLLDSIWDLQAVNANGVGTHSKVGADIGSDPATSANRVRIVGIALNRPDEILNTAMQWQVYVQAQWPEKGGIAAWDAIFFGGDWPRHPVDIQPGDLVEIYGFVEDHNGKVNITTRHSPAPQMQFTITKLASGVGMPSPKVFTQLADCNGFDVDRRIGAERYQAQWVKLQDVRLDSGTWANDESVIVVDDEGSTMTLLLSSEGDFTPGSAPGGRFSVSGILDQEDAAPPATGDYRLWVKHLSDVEGHNDVARWELFQ